MAKLQIHRLTVLDSVLASQGSDEAGLVYLGADAAFPFVVWRRVSGPTGTFVDAFDILAPDGAVLGPWERTFETQGESTEQDVVDELRNVRFPSAGTFTLRYYEFDEVVSQTEVRVRSEEPPYALAVPGPLDSALARSTIAWAVVPGAAEPAPFWYGYENGRLYVLVSELGTESENAEQRVPGLAQASRVRIIARSKDTGSRIADTEFDARVVAKDAEWDRIARDLLLGRRLNLRDGDAALERWRERCEIVMLTPEVEPPNSSG